MVASFGDEYFLRVAFGESSRERQEARNRFEEAMSIFADPLARIFDDPDHSREEQREIIVGQSASHRLLVVSFAERRPLVRILSARKGHSPRTSGL